MKSFFLILIIPLFLPFCTVAQQHVADPALAARLDTMGYVAAAPDSIVELFWKKGAGREALQKVVTDTSLSLNPRFQAAEILFEKDRNYPANTDRKLLAQLYAGALGATLTDANDWGRPFAKNDLGYIGPHLLRIGADAVPILATLLGNEKEMIYWSSGKFSDNSYRYHIRVKDFAAFYICRIMGWHYHCPRLRLLRNMGVHRVKKRTDRLH